MHDVAHEVIGAIALVLEDSFPNSKAVLLPLCKSPSDVSILTLISETSEAHSDISSPLQCS